MEPRRKHGWPFWIAVTLIMAPVVYVLSLGPAYSAWMWLAANPSKVPAVYLEPCFIVLAMYCQPIGLIEDYAPVWIFGAFCWYLTLWLP